ncbi:probable prolyl 4-hydroxylase 9 isoform X1 [Coffea eugenioides]|uniref:probable prolyl 4-hydroxylase 9 isoform X1 n=1 Tax=Coffea eugenioides TaxID=49369 RepID=UPI000F60A912|nr:probable prolyl 4-hydroxylase 9 isoform X1 [Coffea eugenioides]
MSSKGKRFPRFKVALAFPAVVFLCLFFFLAGLFGSIIISQDLTRIGSRHTSLKSVEEEKDGGAMSHGETGESWVRPVPFQILSWRPRTFYFPGFATAAQCQSIIEMARSSMKPSTLALRKGETAESTKGIRTSSGTFISAADDRTGTLDYVERKIAKATRIPKSHGEAFNILRYEVGQRYVSHYDAFNPAEYGPQKSQRVASFLLYLSDVEEGGETMFPYENGLNTRMAYDYKSCMGLQIKPRQGDGLLFYSLFPNGTIDKTSLHGSCPVIKGGKWVATKWIRDQVLDD